jgi:orotate phosphoribosyltransferase
MSIFKHGEFTLHSGDKADFLIDCDALTQKDIDNIAAFMAPRLKPFSTVIGIPQGGLRLGIAMRRYQKDEGGLLIVDDVLTTGASMEKAKGEREDVQGVVIFARGPYPTWIRPLFVMPGRWAT